MIKRVKRCPHCETVFTRDSWFKRHVCSQEPVIIRWIRDISIDIEAPYCPLPMFPKSLPGNVLELTYMSPDIGDVWTYRLSTKNNERRTLIIEHGDNKNE